MGVAQHSNICHDGYILQIKFEKKGKITPTQITYY